MKQFVAGVVFGGFLVTPWVLLAAPVGSLVTFTDGTVAESAEVNANFSAVKTGVDDNDTRLTILEAARPLALHAEQDAEVACITANQEVRIPGASLTVDLATARDMYLQVSGSVDLGNPNPGEQGCGAHWGIGFYVDGVKYGDAQWGDQIGSGGYIPGAWWYRYFAERTVPLQAGTHLIETFAWSYNGSQCTCVRLASREFSKAKLTVRSFP